MSKHHSAHLECEQFIMCSLCPNKVVKEKRKAVGLFYVGELA